MYELVITTLQLTSLLLTGSATRNKRGSKKCPLMRICLSFVFDKNMLVIITHEQR